MTYHKKICVQCGNNFVTKRSDSLTCSSLCYMRKWNIEHRTPTKINSKCKFCGISFVSKRKDRKYCSINCLNKNYARTERGKKNKIAYREKVRENTRKKSNKRTENLSDSYIKTVLRQTGLKNINNEMIEEKRLALKIKRKIKQIQTQLK